MAVTAVVNASNTDNRFVITDISDLSNVTAVYVTAPFDTGEVPTQGCVVDCYGKLAAMGSYQTGYVAIYDLSNPAQPSQQSLIDTGFGGIGAISLNGSYLLVGEASGPQVALIDVSNPKNPSILSSQGFSGLGDQSPPGLTGLGLAGLIAIASDNFSVVVLDYSTISAPQQLPYLSDSVNFQGPIVCAFDGHTAAVGDNSGGIYLFSVPNGAQGPITLLSQPGFSTGNITSIAIQGNVLASCSSSSVFASVAYLTPEISSSSSGQIQIGSGPNVDSGGAVKFYGLPANLATCGITTDNSIYPTPSYNTVTWFSTSNWPNMPQINPTQTGTYNGSPSLNQGLVYTLGVVFFETFQVPWWTWIWKFMTAPFRFLFR